MSEQSGTSRRARAAATALVAVGLFACNAILGAGDYHVGSGDDAGTNDGNGGSVVDGTGGFANAMGGSGAGGKATGTGGKATGTGGRAMGGAPGAGGSSAGGTPGTGGRATGTGGAAGSATDAFVGEWDSAAATVSSDCGFGMPMSDTLSDQVIWSATGPNTIERAFFGCTVQAKVVGNVATDVPGQTCDDSGVTYSVVASTFTIQKDGTAQFDQKVSVDAGSGVTCIGTTTGVYDKFSSM